MRNLNKIVMIGAGAAGLTTAETLRRLGFKGTIMMIHAEHTLPSLDLLQQVQQAVAACPSQALYAEEEDDLSDLALTTSDEEM